MQELDNLKPSYRLCFPLTIKAAQHRLGTDGLAAPILSISAMLTAMPVYRTCLQGRG
jgi:hypothetical protein